MVYKLADYLVQGSYTKPGVNDELVIGFGLMGLEDSDSLQELFIKQGFALFDK